MHRGKLQNTGRKKVLKVSITLSSYLTDPNDCVFSNYKNLYTGNKDLFDWIDYNFCNQIVSLKHNFINVFKRLSDSSNVQKLLARFSIDPKETGNISLEVFLEGCKKTRIQSTNVIMSGTLASPLKPKIGLTSTSKSEIKRKLGPKIGTPQSAAFKPVTLSVFKPNHWHPLPPSSKRGTQQTIASKTVNQSIPPSNRGTKLTRAS